MQALMGGDEIYHYHTKVRKFNFELNLSTHAYFTPAHLSCQLMMKEAKTGGGFVWHQDYGYWYQNGCLFPEMATVFIPVDRYTSLSVILRCIMDWIEMYRRSYRCMRENGCLQVLQGSHKCGRIDHKLSGDQAGADPQRLEDIKNVCPLIYLELEPGDAVFFHCNLLHCRYLCYGHPKFTEYHTIQFYFV